MRLTEKQLADYQRLKAYYPYRLFFLGRNAGETEFSVWCFRDRRAVNKAIREGGEVFELKGICMYPEIQELRDRLNRRAAFRQSIFDFSLFVVLPLFAGLAIERLLP